MEKYKTGIEHIRAKTHIAKQQAELCHSDFQVSINLFDTQLLIQVDQCINELILSFPSVSLFSDSAFG